MNESTIPPSLISIDQFSRTSGISNDRVIKRIRSGVYAGQLIKNKWYVEKSCLEINIESDEILDKPTDIGENFRKKANKQKESAPSNYRLGRMLCSLFVVFGALAMIAGIFALIAIPNMNIPSNKEEMATIAQIGVPWGLSLLASSQVMRAIFDIADR